MLASSSPNISHSLDLLSSSTRGKEHAIDSEHDLAGDNQARGRGCNDLHIP